MSTNVHVTRERVLELIKLATLPLTTKEMARILKVKERSVRAAIFWLGKAEFIEQDGFITTKMLMIVKNKTFKGKRKIYLYKWTGKNDPIKKIQIKNMNQVELHERNKNYGDVNLLQDLMMKMRVSA